MKQKMEIDLANQDGGISSPNMDRAHYPSFLVTQYEADYGKEGDLDDAPIEGTMVIKYCIARSSEDNKTGRCDYTIEVKQILSVEGEKESTPYKRDTSAEDALDKLAGEKNEEAY